MGSQQLEVQSFLAVGRSGSFSESSGAFEREEDAFQALVEKDQDDLRETLLKAWTLVVRPAWRYEASEATSRRKYEGITRPT